MHYPDRTDRLRRIVAPTPASERGPVRRWLGRLLSIGVVALFLAGVAVAPGAAVSMQLAADLPPGVPNPVNVLPSTVSGALSGLPGNQQYLGQLLYSYGRSPDFWRAVAAQQGGTATAGQLTLVQQQNGNWGLPATKPSALSRIGAGVGGVTTVVAGYQLGATIGAGTLDLVGLDASGTVCRAVNDGELPEFVAAITGYGDCAGTTSYAPAYVPNDGVTGGTDWGAMMCSTSGAGCSRFTSIFWKTSGSTQYLYTCFARSWTSTSAPSGTHIEAWINFGGGQLYVNPGGVSQTSSNNVNVLNSECIPIAPDSTIGTRTTQTGGYAFYGQQVETIQWRLAPSAPTTTTIPESISADPERRLRCVVAWSGGSAVGWSAYYRESEGVLPTPNCPDPPADFAPTSVQVFEVYGDTETLLWDLTPTPEYTAATVLAPECMDGTCMLDLRKEGASCFQAPASCAGWFADPDKGTRYSCHYGAHAVDLAECTVYAPTFEPGSSTTGDTLGDPVSGGAVANPNPTPGSDPDGSGRQCWPSGWSVFNPLEWVYRPLVCAFVPRASVVQGVATSVSGAWAGTLPGQAAGWVGGIETFLGGIDLEIFCQGPTVVFGPPLDDLGISGEYHPLDACDEPMAGIAAMARLLLPAFVAFGAAFALVRYVAGVVGFVAMGTNSSPDQETKGVHFR